MERIQYITRDNSSHRGKNNIFFAAHPEDGKQYFEVLQQDIFRVEENCAFWYDAQPERPWDDSLTESLVRTGIQLFLFPVTAKLLSGKNAALTHLLPFARKENIPILPILMEPDLGTQYARIFGDLQYLDKVTVDVTAIPFEDKLQRFLRDILIDAATAEKIREAFDAYVFLSYRKKDRALAANLMRLIHEIPRMRDVAIWYDEFLVPGENFNDTIAGAMAKSDVFTMAVTPNLVNETNYVLTTEYPEARKAEKPILPVEVAHTEPADFRREFQELSGCVDAYDPRQLEQALLERFSELRHITLSQNDDPLHTYLIGLAYLNGIDVEMDPAKALALITDAGEKGCPDAMQALANLYHTGHTVTRDPEAALHWQNRYLQARKAEYEQSGCAEAKARYIHALAGLGQVQESRLDVPAACAAYEEAAALLETIPEPDPEQKRWLYNLWDCLGRLHSTNRDLTQACMYFSRCASAWETLADEQADALHLRKYAGGLMLLGASLLESGDPAGACSAFEQAYQACAKAMDLSRDDTTVNYTAACYSYLGIVFTQLGRFDEAGPLLKTACDEFLTLAQRTSNPRYYTDYARTNLELGRLWDTAENYSEAIKTYQLSIDIYQRVASKTGDLSVLQNLGAAYLFQAEACLSDNKLEDALPVLDKALACALRLNENGQALGARSNLSKVYLTMAKAALLQGSVTAAEEHFRNALDNHLQLCSQSDSASLREELYLILTNHMMGLFQQGYWRQAKRQCRANKAIAQEMIDQFHMLHGFRLMRETCDCLKQIYRELNDPDQAAAQSAAATEWAEKAAACSELYLDHVQLTMLYNEQAAVFESQGEITSALMLYQKSVEDLDLVDQTTVIPIVSRLQVQAYIRIAVLLWRSGNLPGATDAQAQALERARDLAENTNDPDNLLILAECLWNTGMVASGQPEETTAKEAMAILEQLCSQYPRNMDYRTRRKEYTRLWKNRN